MGELLLIVDDNEMNRDILSRRLALRGYEVVQAESGAAALEAVSAQAPALVLLDLMMTDMSGVDVLHVLRRTWTAEALPVVVVSASNHAAQVEEAMAAGANDYLTKPLDMKAALARIQELLARRRGGEG